MKTKHLLCSFFFICMALHIFAQSPFTAEIARLDVSSKKLLDESISDYTTFTIDQNALQTFLGADQTEKQLRLTIGNHQFQLELTPYELRAPGFQAILVTPNGEEDYTSKLNIGTYVGHNMRNPAEVVRLTISPYSLEGFIEQDNSRYMIMPLVRLSKSASDRGIFVLHRLSDLNIQNYCDEDGIFDPGTVPQTPIKEEQTPGTTPSSPIEELIMNFGCGQTNVNTTTTKTKATCRVLQVAADADTEYVTGLGGGFFGGFAAFSTVFNDILSSEPMLVPFGARCQITRIRVFSPAFGSQADTDPYPDNTLGFPEPMTGVRICDFRNMMEAAINTEWGGSVVPNDIVLVFTGAPICNPATVPGTPCTNCPFPEAGCPNAWASSIGGICNAVTFGVIGQCVPNFTSVAHEIGHNMGGTHGDAQPCGSGGLPANPPTQPCAAGGATATIMCPNLCPDRGLALTTGNVSNTANFNAVIAGGNCLDDTDIGSIDGPSTLCAGSTATYQLVDWFNVASAGIFTFPNITWSTGPGLTNTNGIYSTNVTANSFLGPSWVQATLQINGCTITLRRNVYVNGSPLFDCQDYIICDLEIIFGLAPPGTTVDNLECFNCQPGDFDIRVFPNYVWIRPQNPNSSSNYFFSYTITNSCGTFTNSIGVGFDEDCFLKKQDPFANLSEDAQAWLREQGLSEDLLPSKAQLKVMPNPTSASITVNFELSKSSNQTNMRLYDLSGKTVGNIMTNEQLAPGAYQRTFNLEYLPKGTYLLHLITEEGTFVEKVVKL